MDENNSQTESLIDYSLLNELAENYIPIAEVIRLKYHPYYGSLDARSEDESSKLDGYGNRK